VVSSGVSAGEYSKTSTEIAAVTVVKPCHFLQKAWLFPAAAVII
jgi:hypothetical protein